jgi:hypothetical protein
MKTHVLLAVAGLAIGLAVPTFGQEQKTVPPEVRQKIEAIETLATEPDRWFAKLKSFVGTEPDLDVACVYLGKD